ncbi:MAG: PHP domain-containing protein [Blautia sp.]|nr:PHP domain-containing protein [Blautia sp.]
MYLSDLHTHTIASGHGTDCTVNDMAREASRRGLQVLGITDHGPATLTAGTPSYFRSLAVSPHRRFGITLLYGAECSILNNNGDLDLEDEILELMDYCIVSFHRPVFLPKSEKENTQAAVRALHHPGVKILGHMDDTRYRLDYFSLLSEAREAGVVPEINEASLRPDGYRGDTTANCMEILKCCRRLELPVILSSDSHGTDRIGDFTHAEAMVHNALFPEGLILNNLLPEIIARFGASFPRSEDICRSRNHRKPDDAAEGMLSSL